jgi:V8-like Glu-specific endopeptidase
MKRQLLYLILLIFNISNNIFAQYSLQNTKIFESAIFLQFKGNNGQIHNGSGFFVREKTNTDTSFVYLVTAKHVLGKTNPQGDFILKDKLLNIAYRDNIYSEKYRVMSIDIQTILNKGGLKFSNDTDVAVCLVAKNINGSLYYYKDADKKEILFDKNINVVTIPDNYITDLDNVKITNDVFIVGYPTSIYNGNYPQFNFIKPLVKKGIVSGIFKKKKTIILDCSVFGGNSGGPVFGYSPEASNMKLIGLVIEYIPNTVNSIKTNSGYSIAVSSEVISEVISTF